MKVPWRPVLAASGETPGRVLSGGRAERASLTRRIQVRRLVPARADRRELRTTWRAILREDQARQRALVEDGLRAVVRARPWVSSVLSSQPPAAGERVRFGNGTVAVMEDVGEGNLEWVGERGTFEGVYLHSWRRYPGKQCYLLRFQTARGARRSFVARVFSFHDDR